MSFVPRSGLLVRRRFVGIGASALAAVLLTGCGGGPSGDAAQQAAVAFVHAMLGHDGARACSMLTTNAKSSVAGATKVSCEEAILQVDEKNAPAGVVEVWGDSAQVKIGADTIFLLSLGNGWRVDAAGCKPAAPHAPYHCDIGG